MGKKVNIKEYKIWGQVRAVDLKGRSVGIVAVHPQGHVAIIDFGKIWEFEGGFKEYLETHPRTPRWELESIKKMFEDPKIPYFISTVSWRHKDSMKPFYLNFVLREKI